MAVSSSARARHEAGAPLQPCFETGFVYSDGWVDDARLVALCAVDAAARGARVLTRTRCESAHRDAAAGRWQARLVDGSGREIEVRARALVNAAGPWAEQFLRRHVKEPGLMSEKSLRLIRGSHIVVRKLFDHDYAYIFQNADRRIVFAIPYEREFTLIGTTDVEHHGDPGQASISAAETDYLCRLINIYFRRSIAPSDVVWSYSGVRPLLDDASGDPAAVTRDYALELNTRGAPLLTLWGGKLTTFRRLAEEATDTLVRSLEQSNRPWTERASLPGGDLSATIGAARRPDADFEKFYALMRQKLPWIDAALLRRYARAYGARIDLVLAGADRIGRLGALVAPGLYEAELRYLVEHEWARTGEDVLWRRTKLGLHLNEAGRVHVHEWMARHG